VPSNDLASAAVATARRQFRLLSKASCLSMTELLGHASCNLRKPSADAMMGGELMSTGVS
jgi:hypothetical protein